MEQLLEPFCVPNQAGQDGLGGHQGPWNDPGSAWAEPGMMPKWSQNDPKIIPKSSQNHSKMIPKSYQNDPKIIPKWFQNHPKITQKSTQNHPQTYKNAKMEAKSSRKTILEALKIDFEPPR